MPVHVNPPQNNSATAPYNFVPLPNQILSVAEGIQVHDARIKPWEMHDQYIPDTHSGSVKFRVKTLTPLFIRGARNRQGDHWDTRESRLRPAPYTTHDGHPAIPGSSLRGMVRSLVEILSFSKIQPVSNNKPFFRSVADDRIGRTYRVRMTADEAERRGGILRISEAGTVIETREVLRVRRDILRDRDIVIFDPQNSNYTPPWPPQHSPCWVKVNPRRNEVSNIELTEPESAREWHTGVLVLTGNAPAKKCEFVFVDSKPEEIQVPDAFLQRFHDNDQITQWQQSAYPKDQPSANARRSPGHLRDGEPVFFVCTQDSKSDENPNGLVFLGRAGMFRFPYDRTPHDLVPDYLRNADVDLTEAMFGKVDKHGARAFKGRLRFLDAIAVKGGPHWCESTLVPPILSSPKLTTFQHYLTQDGRQGRHGLTTYISGDHTTIRGHKLYWHRYDQNSNLTQFQEPNQHGQKLADLREQGTRHTQHTIIRPIRSGVVFSGQIHFENLTNLELGALLHALELPGGCAHRLGMGRPLGLGSIQISVESLNLVDRMARYRAWQATGESQGDPERFRREFEIAVVEHATKSQETMLSTREGLRKIARLDALFQILTWNARPARTDTEYMPLANFRNRPILRTPHAVMSEEEPWPDEDSPIPAANTVTSARRDAQRESNAQAQNPRTAEPRDPIAQSAPRAAIPASLIARVGQRIRVELLSEKTRKGGWRARSHEYELEGHIQNWSEVPGDKQSGDQIEVEVKIVKGHDSAFAVPPLENTATNIKNPKAKQKN